MFTLVNTGCVIPPSLAWRPGCRNVLLATVHETRGPPARALSGVAWLWLPAPHGAPGAALPERSATRVRWSIARAEAWPDAHRPTTVRETDGPSIPPRICCGPAGTLLEVGPARSLLRKGDCSEQPDAPGNSMVKFDGGKVSSVCLLPSLPHRSVPVKLLDSTGPSREMSVWTCASIGWAS